MTLPSSSWDWTIKCLAASESIILSTISSPTSEATTIFFRKLKFNISLAREICINEEGDHFSKLTLQARVSEENKYNNLGIPRSISRLAPSRLACSTSSKETLTGSWISAPSRSAKQPYVFGCALSVRHM
ncbi:hypothetical protein WR25_09113 [Diploscapter pachys]|uniref:Uncharacterized protein n=1 Tax=Diploscapter pachys TaxID=2018661 RepID=A0A2A2LPC3_9BILA|nr:hypothetical protein WR25_09113 [Diploscapter pachys]